MTLLTTRSMAVVLGCLALVACRGDISREPPVHLNQNMDQQNRFEAQEETSLFEDGRAMRPHVEGTVAVGTLEEDPHVYWGKNADGGFATALPSEAPVGTKLALDRALLERGQDRYTIFCTPCHDGQGTGKGTVVERGMMPPPSFHDERVLAMPIGQIFNVITEGARNMQPYRKQVQLRDRWAIAAYVRALQLSRRAGLSDVPADRRGAERWGN
jgi:mono/diheme cytochrome c family protein